MAPRQASGKPLASLQAPAGVPTEPGPPHALANIRTPPQTRHERTPELPLQQTREERTGHDPDIPDRVPRKTRHLNRHRVQTPGKS